MVLLNRQIKNKQKIIIFVLKQFLNKIYLIYTNQQLCLETSGIQSLLSPFFAISESYSTAEISGEVTSMMPSYKDKGEKQN